MSLGAAGEGSRASSSVEPDIEEAASRFLAPHMLRNPPVEYTVVIPTMGRWRAARIVNPHERGLRNVCRPFIVEKTLSFLGRHSIPKDRVCLFVADAEEEQHYQRALGGTDWEGTRVVVGVRGIAAQRNLIVRQFPEGEYIVSIDDDVSDVLWKQGHGQAHGVLKPLPDGALEEVIFDAHRRMREYGAHICGLNSTVSQNVLNMQVDGISTRNGEINGCLYFFVNRHDKDLLPTVSDATEDAERSLRYFNKDHVVLRYRMYCVKTRCFQNRGGLQSLYGEWDHNVDKVNARRKDAERDAAMRLHEMFPDLTGLPRRKKGVRTLEIHFLSKGGCVIPSTTPADLRWNHEMEGKAVAQAQISRVTKRGSTRIPDPCRTARTSAPDEAAAPQTPPGAPAQEEAPPQDGGPSRGSGRAPDWGAISDDGAEEEHPGGRGEAAAEGSPHGSGVVSGDGRVEEECSARRGEAAAEDRHLFDALEILGTDSENARSSGEAEAVRAFRCSWSSLNGSFLDPLARALRESEESFREESRRLSREERNLESVLAMSLAVGGAATPVPAVACQPGRWRPDLLENDLWASTWGSAGGEVKSSQGAVATAPPPEEPGPCAAARATVGNAGESDELVEVHVRAPAAAGSLAAAGGAEDAPSAKRRRMLPGHEDTAVGGGTEASLARDPRCGAEDQCSAERGCAEPGREDSSFRQMLAEMGFKLNAGAANLAFRDSGGRIDVAVAMLVSQG